MRADEVIRHTIAMHTEQNPVCAISWPNNNMQQQAPDVLVEFGILVLDLGAAITATTLGWHVDHGGCGAGVFRELPLRDTG